MKKGDAFEMMPEIKDHLILGTICDMERGDKDNFAKILIWVGQTGIETSKTRGVDINPFIITADKPVAVDALVIFKEN